MPFRWWRYARATARVARASAKASSAKAKAARAAMRARASARAANAAMRAREAKAANAAMRAAMRARASVPILWSDSSECERRAQADFVKCLHEEAAAVQATWGNSQFVAKVMLEWLWDWEAALEPDATWHQDPFLPQRH